MKLKEKIRNKLVEFIMLDKIQEHFLKEINRIDADIEQQEKRSDNISVSIQKTNNIVKNNRADINTLHNTIRNVVSIGADVVPNNIWRDRSWAVICIEGNYNVVKFIDMRGADYREILNYLKQFEGSRMCIDAPDGKWFENEFKWM